MMDKLGTNQQNDMLNKPSMRGIIVYTEGGYLGDSDLFSQFEGISNDKGRDSTAIGDQDSTIFVMHIEDIKKIKNNYEEIYNEMLGVAIKRFKNHKILISKQVKDYINHAAIDSKSDVEDDVDELSEDFFQKSMNSDDLDGEFEKTGNKKVDIKKEQKELVKQPTKGGEGGGKLQLGTAHGKYLERKTQFDKQFEQTLENFSTNIDFLVHQQRLA